MTYSESVATAPPGAATFVRADLDRLPLKVRTALLEGVPADERRLFEQGDAAAGGRVLRAGLWTLVYPRRFDRRAGITAQSTGTSRERRLWQ